MLFWQNALKKNQQTKKVYFRKMQIFLQLNIRFGLSVQCNELDVMSLSRRRFRRRRPRPRRLLNVVFDVDNDDKKSVVADKITVASVPNRLNPIPGKGAGRCERRRSLLTIAGILFFCCCESFKRGDE